MAWERPNRSLLLDFGNLGPICYILLVQYVIFLRAFPEQDVYTTPVYFSSDWLNEYWDAIAVDDYRFVYMGPKGSW